MALSKFLLAFALVSTYLAHLSLAQVDGSTLLYGGTSGQPFQIPEASWADSIAQPNATYTIGISGPKLSEIDHNLTPGAWDISIAVAAEISTVGSSDTSVNQSLVFTGTQVSFAPAFNMTAPKGAEWEVCFAMGFPGITSDDIGAIGPINAGGFNEGYCNFLTLSCQNDLEAAITTALAETKSHSCLDAGPITVPDSCGNTIIWDVLSFLSVNQSTALNGGVLFEYGDLPHSKGNLTAYGDAVNKIWGLLSAWTLTTFNSDGTNSTMVLDSDYNCLQAKNIAKGSYSPPTPSTGASVHFSMTPLLVLVFFGMAVFVNS